ncbi:MAG: FeoA family protein [Corynebacterium sp.]|nr:FeoA family protein [Corynebacterium sp.]
MPHGREPAPHADLVLTSVGIGQRCVLADINTDILNDATRRRLAELGFRPGITITVTQKINSGGRIIKIGGTRYAIDGPTARQLQVTAVPSHA